MPGSPDQGLSDPVLLERSAAGDRDAFDEIVRRHHASVYRLALAVVNRPAEAEDVLQQTFLSAWRHAGQYRGDASARAWLLSIARHAALRWRARRAREPLDETPLDGLGVRAGWGGPDPERLAVAAEDRVRLAEALSALPEEHREILILRDLEELAGDEAAALLGLSLAAMKSRLHRARLNLAAHLKSEVPRATRRA